MKARRAFGVGGWIALLAGGLTIAFAVVVAVSGVLALTGKATYPMEVGAGPLSTRLSISLPVGLDGRLCQQADVRHQGRRRDCFRSFLHSKDDRADSSDGRVRRQDADVRPTTVRLTGHADLVSTGGWSPMVAGSVGRFLVRLAVISAILLLVWRLLAAAAAGEALSGRTARHLRAIGWLLLASAVLGPALDLFTTPGHLGYNMEGFGGGAHVWLHSAEGYPGAVNLGQVGVGVLILLVAAIFRHGAAIEAERRLTV